MHRLLNTIRTLISSAAVLVAILSPLEANSAHEASIAAQIPWPQIKYLIVAQNREVGDVLSDLAQQHGVRSVVSENVKGRISGRFENIPPGELLSQLSRSFNLVWMFHNGILYVGSPVEMQTSLVTLRFTDANTVLNSLGSLGILAPGASVTVVANSPLLSINGLPAYVDLAKHIAETIDQQQQFHQQGEMVIEVFPLNHAWAYDIVLGGDSAGGSGSVGGPGTVVKGVATLLKELVTQGGQSGGSLLGETFSTSGRARAMVGALGSQPQPSSQNPSQGAPAPASDSSSAQSSYNTATGGANPGAYVSNQAAIMADVRRNAVVVRDIRENMPSYKAAIDRLDVPVRIIEISAAIVDLAIGTSRNLGLNSIGVGVPGYGGIGMSSTGRPDIIVDGAAALTRSLGNRDSSNSDTGNTDSSNNQLLSRAGDSGAVSDPPNILASGVFGTTQIMGSINALEQQNKAKTLSRPTVLTLDNFGAAISQQETFYVNSTGQYVSDLFNVSTGLSLQVIPHVTVDAGRERIYLQVKIEDGNLSTRQISSIPIVKQSSLTTQALINRNQSLLVGGLFIKVDKKQSSGYPWLQRIPVLGYLFSVKGKTEDLVERIFVITPRIVEIESSGNGDYSKYFAPAALEMEALDAEAALDLPVPEVPEAISINRPLKPAPYKKK